MIDQHFHTMSDPVGNHARRQTTTLLAEQTVGEALEHLRTQELAERIVYFYVVDAVGQLVGVVPVRRLLMGAVSRQIKEIMVAHVIAIREDETLLTASELILGRHLMALPVVDRENRLIGVVDLTLFTDDVTEVAQQQEREDIFQLLGVRISLARRFSALSGYRDRFPWLLCNIGAGLICALIAGANEHLIAVLTVLPFFIPVVLALAESVSMQSTTLALQGLYHRQHSWRLVWRALRREFLVACLLGMSCGTVVGLFAYLWKDSLAVSLAVGGTIALSIVFACVLGVLIPGLVRAARSDPKISSGPVVLALADIATLVMLFSLAGWLTTP